VPGPAKGTAIGSALSSDTLAKFDASRAKPADAAVAEVKTPVIAPQVQARGNGAVVVDPARRVAVPSFVGDGLRAAVEQAGNAGLRVEPVGSGLARDQVPAAGTMVPVGTEVVVRFSR
jgi:cell division protein FtsI (penicillin-binding protein 3)